MILTQCRLENSKSGEFVWRNISSLELVKNRHCGINKTPERIVFVFVSHIFSLNEFNVNVPKTLEQDNLRILGLSSRTVSKQYIIIFNRCIFFRRRTRVPNRRILETFILLRWSKMVAKIGPFATLEKRFARVLPPQVTRAPVS